MLCLKPGELGRPKSPGPFGCEYVSCCESLTASFQIFRRELSDSPNILYLIIVSLFCCGVSCKVGVIFSLEILSLKTKFACL